MLHILKSTDLNNLFDRAMDEMMNHQEHWDASQTPRLISYNNVLMSNSLEFNFDLSHTGFTKTRWSRYCHGYLDKDQLHEWLESLKLISNRGESLFRSKDMVRRARDHRYGACWIGLSYKNEPATLTLYSRVAEFPTRAALELTLVNKVGQEIATITGRGLKDIHFTWFISSLYLSCLHALPYFEINGVLEEVSKREDAVGHFVSHQLDHMAKGKVKYGPTKRMQKRLEQQRAGVRVPVPIDNLSLWI